MVAGASAAVAGLVDLAVAVPAAAGQAAVGRSEDAMVPGKNEQEKIDEFVKRMREAAGPNLESIILFGSAVSGDFHPGLSNLNMFCVLREVRSRRCRRWRRSRSGGTGRSSLRRCA